MPGTRQTFSLRPQNTKQHLCLGLDTALGVRNLDAESLSLGENLNTLA